jgi:malate dehydrogenase (oxaloacetate-decarboxylating)(NADP+)
MEDELKKHALEYHETPPPGKIEITATKPLANQHDLAMAYSPGVAAPCEIIAQDATKASLYTSRGNLVAVITNGSAVLGLGNIGPLAAKPVMEGKGVLFKKFAGIDVFHHREPRANVRRYKPGGHQIAGMFSGRETTARPRQHPGISR